MADTIIALFSNEETRPYAILGALIFVLTIAIAVILGRPVHFGNFSIGPKEDSLSKNRSNQVISHDLDHFYPFIAKGKYKIVRLPKGDQLIGYRNPSSPKGYHIFYNIPFLFQLLPFTPQSFDDHLIIDIQPNINGDPTIVYIESKIKRVKNVHIMLSAGHGRREHMNIRFEGKRIGWVNIICTNDKIIKEELILGKNIREWSNGNKLELVREISGGKTRPAWTNEEQTYVIDMLSISLGLFPKDISQIQIVAEFEEKSPGVSKPAIRISAITCEC